MGLIKYSQANLPNLRRLFVEARTEAEESAYSRNAVSSPLQLRNVRSDLRIVLQYCIIHVFGRCIQSHCATRKQDQLLDEQASEKRTRMSLRPAHRECDSEPEL
jgi:hypothetical protein